MLTDEAYEIVEALSKCDCLKRWYTGTGNTFACCDDNPVWGRPLPREEWCVRCRAVDFMKRWTEMSRVLTDMIENPPEPSEAMKAALSRKR